ncbi:hypothetical protein LOTGIDRAFT_227845 [Lottia gigantea]|uniref:F5/8 type C domain-containing protein n=1 Tax=Lottia gigantea TaxID=225164 RepID=V4BGW9_LOTGI|nr:hypothetical protein LOTGIDRAFT_227845 [Lottia gigantea]ESP05167.1 hypothetical protein LOTGIDRAFT_227845 [Lottia gigantea]
MSIKMEKSIVWILLLLQLLAAFSVSAEYDPKCEEVEEFKDRYFGDLEVDQDLHDNNKLLSINIQFNHPSYVKSWTVKGRDGPNEGPIHNRSGLILKYTVEYGNQEGDWVPVGPSENNHEFMNDGNLAKPNFETKVSFEEPIKTKALRFFPQLWDGAPYMAVNVIYCVDENDHSQWKEMQINTNLILEALKKVDRNKKKAKVKAANIKAGEDLENESEEENAQNHYTEENADEADVNEANEDYVEEYVEEDAEEDTEEDEEDDDEEEDIEVEDNRRCQTSVVWRYNGEREIADRFSSSSGSSTAYRLTLANLENPFLFLAHDKREYAQVKFAAPSRVMMLRTVGKSDSGDWGLVTQFSLFYRNDIDEKWRYYTDTDGNRRLFDTKVRDKISAMVPEEFRLPRPIVAKIIRLYPHKWSGKPYLSLDVKACYLSDPYPEFKYCSDSLLSQDDSLLLISFDNLERMGELANYQKYRTLELEGIEDESLVTGVKVRIMTDDASRDFVKSFAMQYFNEEDEWKNVVDDDGIIKIFHAYAEESEESEDTAILKFSDPVETGFLRVYPESWTGSKPVLFIDVLGCTDF